MSRRAGAAIRHIMTATLPRVFASYPAPAALELLARAAAAPTIDEELRLEFDAWATARAAGTANAWWVVVDMAGAGRRTPSP